MQRPKYQKGLVLLKSILFGDAPEAWMLSALAARWDLAPQAARRCRRMGGLEAVRKLGRDFRTTLKSMTLEKDL